MPKPNWSTLPPELRLLILELPAREGHGLAAYAQVCKEWQYIIEKRNFRRLKLQVPCLDDLEKIALSRRRQFIRNIWLNIELRPYTCRSCESPESYSWSSDNNSIIGRAISKLFCILSTWTPRGGLTLELSAQSPSDAQHWFKSHYLGARGEDEDISFDQRQTSDDGIHDPKHGWDCGRQVAGPHAFAVTRLYEAVELKSNLELCTVPAVTSFVIRRQCRRQFTPKTLRVLFESLPRLESMVYEPWQAWNMFEKEMRDEEYETMFKIHLPKRIRRISTFEDFLEGFIPPTLIPPENDIFDMDAVRTANPAVSMACAYRSLDLEQLAVSFVVDAQHFFQAYRAKGQQSKWIWKHLQSLSLTSRCLVRTTANREFSNLLQDASMVATRMPKLRTLLLWNAEKGEACAFIYRRERDFATITVKSTWVMELDPRVIQAWRTVTSDLRINMQLLSRSEVSFHGDAIQLLDLPCEVIDTISSRQIRKEGIGRYSVL